MQVHRLRLHLNAVGDLPNLEFQVRDAERFGGRDIDGGAFQTAEPLRFDIERIVPGLERSEEETSRLVRLGRAFGAGAALRRRIEAPATLASL